jgi:insecticidal toxin complex protein TccC
LTERHVTDSSTSWLAETITYGEGATGAADRNQLGRPILVRDGAGEESTPRYGAFGEPLETTRMLTASSGLEPDWSSTVALETSGYTSISAYDALGRRARALLPDGTERQEDYLRMGPVAELRVITPDAVTRTILTGTEYNARGQQIASTLGNGVEVTSVYDTETFRLYQRRAVLPGTDPYQDLRHHYDPVGNLVYLDDLAQTPSSPRVINGLTVTAERTYSYDARYQLTQATGRVHNALTQPDFRGDTPTSGSFRGTRRVGLNDGGAVVRYSRAYSYDDAGNIQSWSHAPEVAGTGNSWTNEKRVSSTSNRSFPAYDLNGIAVSNPGSNFNARGQLTSLPSLRAMEWSVRDLLRRAVLIERTTASDDDETYDYAADGTRVRKTLNRVYDVDNDLVETTETIYLDGCELRRVRRASGLLLERWSSHVADGDQRVATVYHWDSDALARETDDCVFHEV